MEATGNVSLMGARDRPAVVGAEAGHYGRKGPQEATVTLPGCKPRRAPGAADLFSLLPPAARKAVLARVPLLPTCLVWPLFSAVPREGSVGWCPPQSFSRRPVCVSLRWGAQVTFLFFQAAPGGVGQGPWEGRTRVCQREDGAW